MVSNMDGRKYRVFIALGSNVGDKAVNLNKAINLLGRAVGKIINQSSIYETEPWGDGELHQFYNQVVELETAINPQSLLEKCLELEQLMGRKRPIDSIGYINRIIDIDILLIDEIIIDSKKLKIPHPHMHQRKFVLIPINEIDSKIIHPVFKLSVKELLLRCNDSNQVSAIKE